jgi:hypothetical protein
MLQHMSILRTALRQMHVYVLLRTLHAPCTIQMQRTACGSKATTRCSIAADEDVIMTSNYVRYSMHQTNVINSIAYSIAADTYTSHVKPET